MKNLDQKINIVSWNMGHIIFNENLLLVEIRTEAEYLAQDDVYAILIDDRYRIIKEGESNMLYTFTEEEFKVYRECRSEIIKVYNQMTDIYLTGNEAIDRNVEKYSKILGVEKGKKYNGI